VQVKPSDLGGLGVFAEEDYAPGTKLIQFTGPILTLEQSQTGDDHEDHTLQIGPDRYVGPSGKLDDYVNHSCSPNCGIRLLEGGVWLVTVGWVLSDEEFTYDYSTTIYDNDDWVMRGCKCGSKECRVVIGKYSQLPYDTRKAYHKLGIDFVNRWED
jgi:SET domain-containing protein